jgi:cation diffusion facilitator CzcD-associated flavoprotein CzcO
MPAVDASTTIEHDAIVVGAGLSGIYMLKKLRDQGLSVRVLEAGDGVGGTWHWNCYPGARCDVESLAYSYSFDEALQQEWEWSERYPAQPELLRYINHVVDRYDLRRDIQLATRVASAVFDDASDRWTVATSAGETFSAQYVVMATGCLVVEKLPEIDGVETFAGESHHTSN